MNRQGDRETGRQGDKETGRRGFLVSLSPCLLVLRHLALLGIGLFFGLPFYWLVSTALKPDTQIFAMPPVWVPRPPQWANFPRSLQYIPFGLYTWNTLKICLFNVVGTLISCSLVAYSLSKIRWRGRDLVF